MYVRCQIQEQNNELHFYSKQVYAYIYKGNGEINQKKKKLDKKTKETHNQKIVEI